MIKLLVFNCLLLFTFSSIYSQATKEKSRLAVLDLEPDKGVSVKETEYISDILRTELVKTKLFVIIERSSIRKVLAEQAFQQKGCVDTKCSVQIGQLLAADKILEGKVQYISGKYVITANIVDVTTGRLDFAEQTSLNSIEDFESKNEVFIRKISAHASGVDEGSVVIRKPRTPYVWRSAIFPGWGQWHKQDEMKGAIYSSLGIIFLGNLLSQYQGFQNAQADYNSTLGLPYLLGQNAILYNYITINPKRETVLESQNQVNLSLGLLAVFWIFNIGDAYYFEPKEKKLTLFFDLSKDQRFSFDRSQEKDSNYYQIQIKYKF